MKKYYLLISLFLSILGVHGQSLNASKTDSIKSTHFLKKSIVPISLIGVGLLINNSDFERRLQTDLRNKVGNNYVFHIDDYLVFVPVAEMYIADVLGVKAKNHWFNQTKYLFISNLVSYTITGNLKTIFKKNTTGWFAIFFSFGAYHHGLYLCHCVIQ